MNTISKLLSRLRLRAKPSTAKPWTAEERAALDSVMDGFNDFHLQAQAVLGAGADPAPCVWKAQPYIAGIAEERAPVDPAHPPVEVRPVGYPLYLSRAIKCLDDTQQFAAATAFEYQLAVRWFCSVEQDPNDTIEDLEAAHAGLMCAAAARDYAIAMLRLRDQEHYAARRRFALEQGA